MQGGRYLAEDRGAFEVLDAPPLLPPVEEQTQAATAPLYEIAACHDGQQPAAWLRYLMRQYGGNG
jgi:hypothetical protein